MFKIISCKLLKYYLINFSVLLLDLRDISAYNTEHIPGALWQNPETLVKDIPGIFHNPNIKYDYIILYCDHGNTSLASARSLARMGYPVISLGGGFFSWKNNKSML